MAANNTIDESIALITAANTVVQSPEQVGNAFKTISMRIRGAKTELEEAGLETEGMVDSTAKLRSEILALSGVDIMENANEFKSTYQIMDELAAKWQDLTDIQQATITELIAGKRQGNIVSSLMTNFDTAREALDTSLNSAGSAMQEHEKWQQSLEAQINKLKAAWQGLSQAFLSSDFLHGALDAVIGLVDGLTKLIDTLGVVPTLATAFSIFQSFKGGGFFKPLINEATGAAKGITNIFSEVARRASNTFKEIGLQKDGLFKQSIDTDIEALNNYQNKLKEVSKLGVDIDEDTFNKIFENASISAKEFAESGKLASESVDAFINSQKSAQVATLAQNKSLGNAAAIIKEYYGGCKNVQMSQGDFADAVRQTNPQLATQLVTSKSATGALAGYTAATVGARIGTAALKVGVMALNAALTMGIGLLVSWAFEGIMKLINADEELAEKVDEITSKFKEQSNELQKLKGNYDASNESSMISKYEKLSKGVDNLGRNVSLTADEYSEYQSIVNQIAEQIPSLISGYDSQGNALLSCKGNVEELTAAYEKLIKAQNNEIFKNVKDIGEDFENSVEETEKSDKNLDVLKKLVASGHKEEGEISKFLFDNYAHTAEIIEALEGYGVDIEGSWFWDSSNTRASKTLSKLLETDPDIINDIIADFEADLEAATEGMGSIAQATLSDAFDISDSEYFDMSDTLQGVARNIVNGFDFEFYKQFKDNPLGVKTYINDMLDQLKSFEQTDGTKIEAAFDLQTQFNGGEISYGEYVDGLVSTGKTIDELVSSGKLDKEIGTQIKLSVGLNEDGLVDEYQRLRNRLASSEYFNISEPEYESFIKGLSSEELSVVWNVIPELEETSLKENIEQVKAALKKEMILQGLTFDLNLEVETAGIEALNTAMAESVSGAGLSSDSISALKSRYADLENQGWDLSAMFEETSHGIHLNRQELNKFEKAYASQKLEKVNGDLSEMKATYDELGEQLKTCGDEAKAGIYNERLTLAQKISEAATLAAQYEGLTSAYNDWLAAEEAGQERDMYENVISGFETIDDEVSRGWYDDSTREFIEMLTGKDMGTASIDELKKAYENLDKEIKNTGYSIRDFFTVDDEGNSTADGVYRFLKAVETLESDDAFKKVEGIEKLIQRDKNGKIIKFDFGIVGGDEAIAEALGISEELVQIMKRAASDAGFVITLDGSYQQLADLENAANAAADKLKSLGKTKFDFNLNTTNVKDLTTQLTEAKKILEDKSFWNADGTFNFEAEGAEEAMQLVSTLQAKLDYLTQEQYGIGLTVEDEEFEEPLENLQEYGNTVATLNQLKLNPKVNAEKITELEGNLKGIAEYFANLDEDLKVELGFEADDNWEEVQKKIESGEVKIPTVLDIQANMDKNIETLADLALLDSGLLSDSQEETIKKKYEIELEGDVDNSGLKNDVEDSVDDAVNGDNKATREQNIEIIANVFGVEDVDDLTSKLKGLDDKTIQAIAEVLGRTDVDSLQNTMAKLEPKTVEAIAKAIGKGDVEGLKEAIVNIPNKKHAQAIAEAFGYDDVNALAAAVDNLDPKTVQAIAQALGISDVNTLQVTINNMHGNTVDAKVDTSGQAGKVNSLQITIDGMQGNTVKAGVNTDGQASKVDTLQAKINSLKGKIVNVGVQLAAGGKKKAAQRTGADPAGNDSELNGTANVNGTIGRAFARGDWRTKKTETALVGELGRKIFCDHT